MALLPRIQTNFLNADSTAQLSAQQLGSGFDALAGGISKGFEQRRQNEQLKVKAAADKAASDRKLGMIEMKNTMDTIEKITGGDEEQMKVLFGKVDPRFAIGGELDISGLAKGKVSELLINLKSSIEADDYAKIQKTFNDIQVGGTAKQKVTAKNMMTTVVKPLPLKVSVDQNTIDDIIATNHRKKYGTEIDPKNITFKMRKEVRDELFKNETTRLDERITSNELKKQYAQLQDYAYNTNTGEHLSGATRGDVIDNENIVSLTKGQHDQYNSIRSNTKDKMELVDTMRAGLAGSKDGLLKFKANVVDFFTNSSFTKQFKPAAVSKMKDLVVSSVSAMQMEMGMGKQASDKDMAAVMAKFADIKDPDAANEAKIMIFEDAIDNLASNFLRKAKMKGGDMKSMFRNQIETRNRAVDFISDTNTKKNIMGNDMTFGELYKDLRKSGSTLKEILNAWDSPNGLVKPNKTMDVDIATEANRGDGIPPNESKRERIIRETKAKFGK